jgi:hypothetical protein
MWRNASISFWIVLSMGFSFLEAVNLMSMKARSCRVIKGIFAPYRPPIAQIPGGENGGDSL